jgi:hypothetical protein
MRHLFLALGVGDHISPILGAWTPNLIFAVIGLYLLYLRSTNREGLRFQLAGARRIFAR